MKTSNGLSRRIAEHVATYPTGRLPPSAMHAAKRALLDGIGVMLAASGVSEDALPFIAHAEASGPGPAVILGRGTSTSAPYAAFANGAMAHALDFEDAFDAAPSHPNASLLPAVLGIAAGRPGISGADMLAAIAVGCDLVCRLGLSLRRPMEAGGWYPPPILGAFGAAAACARLLRHSPRQILDSFSMMLCQTTCPGEIKYSRDTVIRAVREAFPAQAAVQSVLMAELGVRGFDEPFEGVGGFFRLYADGQYDGDIILDGLGDRFWIEQLSFKQWPACRGTHPYIEAAQFLRRQERFDTAQIVEIVATGGHVQRMLAEPLARKQAPAVAIDAKFSIPFTIGAALIDQQVTLASFDAVSLADPRKLALARLVRFEQRPDWGPERAASGTLTIRFDDGRTIDHFIDVALGHPSRSLDDGILVEKFIDCAARAHRSIGSDQASALADTIMTSDRMLDVEKWLRAFCYTA